MRGGGLMGFGQGQYHQNDFREGDRIRVDRHHPGVVKSSGVNDSCEVELAVSFGCECGEARAWPNLQHIEYGVQGKEGEPDEWI